ncbi:MAG: hypothetical protein WA823_01560 [Candidatus Acidiferrales bacterium]
MTEEKQIQDERRKQYEPPKIIRVSLRPEEAVLGHCKIPGASGPVSASCAAVACQAFGS